MPNLKNHWPNDVASAKQVQLALRGQVETQNRFGKIHSVAGVDVGFEDQGRITRAAVVCLHYPELELAESAVARRKTDFPYIPGYLSFREVPALLQAIDQLQRRPDLILCDGQGLAHPRRFGIACHLGVLLDLPTIGVAKSRLLGSHETLGPNKGQWVALCDKDETIGAVLRTRTDTKPLYVSIGHRVDLVSAIAFVLRCTPKYRLPETTRWAHKLASQKNLA